MSGDEQQQQQEQHSSSSYKVEVRFPYLKKAGLQINIDDLSSAEGLFDTVQRLNEHLIFTNGIMFDIRKLVKPAKLTGEKFFSIVKMIVPLSIQPVLIQTNAKNFGSKLQTFEKKLKDAQKRKNISEFLDEPFIFETKSKCTLTPQKRKLMEQVSTLTEAKKSLTDENASLQENEVELSEQLNQKDLEISAVKEKLDAMVKTHKSLDQKIKGMKSGYVRKLKVALSYSFSTSTNDSSKHHNKHTLTEISDISSDLVAVHNQKGAIFTGKRYFGTKSSYVRKSDGKVRKYFEIPEYQEKTLEITKKELQRRIHLIEDVMKHVSKGETEILYGELVNLNKDMFRKIIKNTAGISLTEMMSSKDAVAIQSLLRLPTRKMRNLRVCLNNLRMNVFPSEKKTRKEKSPLTSHITNDSIETGFIGLHRTKNDDNISACPYLKVKSLFSFLHEVIDKDPYGFNFEGGFNEQWWFLFSGDKGGSHMKYFAELVNSRNAGSVDNVHIYAIFEAQDSTENMMKVWFTSYHQQVKEILDSNFRMKDGRSVKVFLGGDYHFLDDNLGHQGSSATYPSAFDKVILGHLQHHPLSLHTPDTCNVETHSITDYYENYNENLSDNRNGEDMHLNGK